MTILSELSSSQDRRDQGPNRALAARLAASGTEAEIAELFGIVRSGKRAAAFDAIVVIFEVAGLAPKRILPHADDLLGFLKSKHNRVVWGTLDALEALCAPMPEAIMAHLNEILDAADRGSVIAKDRTMSILAQLNRIDRFHAIVTPVILQRLTHAAVNQTPMYAEMAAPTMRSVDIPGFRAVVSRRLSEISYPAKRKRLEKVLDRLPG